MKKAFLFDLNGTVIDDMKFHTEAWYRQLTELGASMSMDEVKLEMYGKNQEVLARVFGEGRFTAEEMERISWKKEELYQGAYRPHLKLINGLDDFLEKAYKKGISMAIGSAAITFNIDFVLDGLDLRKYFSAAVSADHVKESKPHPETFLMAAAELGAEPQNCIVFEDNPKGVEAALRAGMKSVVITTMHTPDEFEGLTNILKFIEDYTDPWLPELLK